MFSICKQTYKIEYFVQRFLRWYRILTFCILIIGIPKFTSISISISCNNSHGFSTWWHFNHVAVIFEFKSVLQVWWTCKNKLSITPYSQSISRLHPSSKSYLTYTSEPFQLIVRIKYPRNQPFLHILALSSKYIEIIMLPQ